MEDFSIHLSTNCLPSIQYRLTRIQHLKGFDIPLSGQLWWIAYSKNIYIISNEQCTPITSNILFSIGIFLPVQATSLASQLLSYVFNNTLWAFHKVVVFFKNILFQIRCCLRLQYVCVFSLVFNPKWLEHE